MVEGTDNLARLFETGNIARPEDLQPDVFGRALENYQHRLRLIRSELDTEPRKDSIGRLSYVLCFYWPNISLEQSAENPFSIALTDSDGQISYSRGHAIAADLFLNPSRALSVGGFERVNPQFMDLSGGGQWRISDTPIRSNKKIVVGGKLVVDRVDVLHTYLEEFERGIERDIAGLTTEGVAIRNSFYIGPDAGLSLIGYGDALLKAAKTDGQREGEYRELAGRSYKTSGFRDTLYVGNRLLEIGQIPPKAYFVVPSDFLTVEQRQTLMGGNPQ